MPLPIDKLRAVKKIIVHKSCADGMASAVILHDVLPDAEIRFILYNTPEHTAMEPEEGLLICNFSPPGVNRSEAMDLEAKAEIEREIGERYAAAGTMLLDHHRQAKDIVMGFGDMGVFADEIERPGIAGANLAYEEVWIPLCGERDSYEQHNVETIARLSGIRDTWRRNDPEWKPACYLAEAFRFFPAESWIDKSDTFSQIHQSWWAERRIMGKTLFERTEKAVKRAIENSWRFTTPLGTRVVMFSGTRLSSDAAELLHEDADFVVGFDYMGVTDNQTASLVYSTRSHTGYDCGAFCKAHGACSKPMRHRRRSQTQRLRQILAGISRSRSTILTDRTAAVTVTRSQPTTTRGMLSTREPEPREKSCCKKPPLLGLTLRRTRSRRFGGNGRQLRTDARHGCAHRA
jgi:hypothetical protein